MPGAAGLATYGATLSEAREMAHDAMRGYIESVLSDGEEVPESDAPHMGRRFDRLGRTLRDEGASPVFEHLSIEPAAAA